MTPACHSAGFTTVLRAVALASILLTAPSAAAQTIGCDPGTAARTKVLLSDVTIEGDEIDAADLRDALYFQLTGRLEDLRSKVVAVPLLVQCVGRKPSWDGTDHPQPMVTEFNISDVLLETWGSVRARQTAPGVREANGRLAYYLVPIGVYEPNGSVLPLQLESFQREVGDSIDDLAALISDAPRFDIFAAVALGLKQMRNNDYDAAKKSLCVAQLLLAEDEASTPSNGSHNAGLAAYINAKLLENATNADSDNTYNGVLKPESAALGAPNVC